MSRDKLDFLMPTKFEAPDVFRLATVTSINPLKVRIDGDDTALTASPFKLYHPYVGDRVLLQIHGKTPIVIGKLSPGPDQIPNLTTENLNSVTDTGVYFQPANANSTLARNYPVTYAGMLEVFSPNSNNQFIYQRYTTYSSHGSAVYTRGQYNGGSWSTWNTLAGTKNSGNLSISGVTGTASWIREDRNVFIRYDLNGSITGDTAVATLPSEIQPSALIAASECQYGTPGKNPTYVSSNALRVPAQAGVTRRVGSISYMM